MKTVQVSDATHRALMQRKLDGGLPSVDAVLAPLLGLGTRRARLEALGPALDRLLRKHGVARLRVFGSAAREADTPTSDLDLIVDFAGKASLFDLAELGDALEAMLGTRVDLTTEPGLHPRLRKRIVAEAEEVWRA